jgi:hypothetical protein
VQKLTSKMPQREKGWREQNTRTDSVLGQRSLDQGRESLSERVDFTGSVSPSSSSSLHIG